MHGRLGATRTSRPESTAPRTATPRPTPAPTPSAPPAASKPKPTRTAITLEQLKPSTSYDLPPEEFNPAQIEYEQYIEMGYSPDKALEQSRDDYPEFSGPAAPAPYTVDPDEAINVYSLSRQAIKSIISSVPERADDEETDEDDRATNVAIDSDIEKRPMALRIQASFAKDPYHAVALFPKYDEIQF